MLNTQQWLKAMRDKADEIDRTHNTDQAVVALQIGELNGLLLALTLRFPDCSEQLESTDERKTYIAIREASASVFKRHSWSEFAAEPFRVG